MARRYLFLTAIGLAIKKRCHALQEKHVVHRSLITDIAAWSNSEGYAVNVILESSASKGKV